MGENFDEFCSDIRTKIDDADRHLKGLQATAKNAGQKARDDAKALLAALEVIDAVIARIDADAVQSTAIKTASRPDRKSNSSSNTVRGHGLSCEQTPHPDRIADAIRPLPQGERWC